MLPFMQPKRMTTTIMAARKPSGAIEQKEMEGEHSPALMSAAEDLVRAVHSKDAHSVAAAMKAGHAACCDDADAEIDSARLPEPSGQQKDMI